MRQKVLGKPSIDILCFTANISEVRFSPPATMLYQHTEGSGPPYENLGTVRHKMRQKNLDTLFGFYLKTECLFNKLKGLPTIISVFRDRKIDKKS